MTEEEQRIYQKFEERFKEEVSKNKRIQDLAEKLANGTATYKDAWEYANKVGRAGSKALIEQADQLIAEEIDGYETIMDALYDCYDQSATYAATVQTLENQKGGLGIKGAQANFDRSRASGIAHLGSNAEDAESASRVLGTPVEHFTENVVGDTIKANEEFQYRSGLNPKIKRTSSGKCCQWCDEIAGIYDYPAPDEVYRRHQNCNCIVEYHPGNGLKQNVHNKRWTADAEPSAIVDRITIISERGAERHRYLIESDSERYRHVRLGREEEFKRDRETIKARKVERYSENNLYIENGIELSSRDIRRFNQRINEAKDKMGLIGKCKAPMIITNDNSIVASYNPRLDTFFINVRFLDEKNVTELQSMFVRPDDRSSSLIHELFHWKDATDYRQFVGKIHSADPQSAYSVYQRERAYSKLANSGINIEDPIKIRELLGEYAYRMLLDNNFEEVYTELRTKILLEGAAI